MSTDSLPPGAETCQQRFERLLSQGRFEGLKAILARICSNSETLLEAVRGANSYEELLGRLGHKVLIIRQIHVQDCYSRLGQQGGIKAVVPYHDIPTQSSLPTLVNYDSTVTTTAKSAAFFNGLLLELKQQLGAPIK
ncbi:MAG TPA: hypothetical protein VNT26_23705 [Candidatus Sulfotelmatobacter sp.]|nr:hypothetical protein [Candidatus Sulfotelmatobacter sp.]HWI56527.1 hypothetical protein [Bacillota bacterium]